MIPVFLENDRLYLRTLSKEDDLKNYECWINNQANTIYMGSGNFPETSSSLKKYVEDFEGSKNGILLGIFLKETDAHIGNITLQQINWKDGYGEIGIIIGDEKQWGKGYATDSIRLVVEHAFNKLNLRKIYSGIVDGNGGSIKAFEKVGFKKEGLLREHFYLNNKYHDYLRYGLLRKECKR